MSIKMLKAFSDTYGPYAFGLVALLIIWKTIVQPDMERSHIDYEEFTKGAAVMQDAANTLARTAGVMDRTSERLERMEARAAKR